ncbi:MAG: hypothetical protein ACREXW_13425 [Gammaproteobacteria bacterium]
MRPSSTRLDQLWDQLFPAEQQRIVRRLVETVVVLPHDIVGQATSPRH